MKKYYFLQIFPICLLLAVLTAVIVNIDKMKLGEYEYLESIPIVVYSYDCESLENETGKLTKYDYVGSAVIESSESITDSLIKKYDLKNIKKVIGKVSLPNIMYIRIIGEKFNEKAKNNLLEQLNKKEKGFALDYNDRIWEENNRRLELFNTAENAIFLTFYLIIFLIRVFMRNYAERRNEKYWTVYLHAGGDFKRVKKMFRKNSFLPIFLPVLFNFTVIFLFTGNFEGYGLTNILILLIVLLIADLSVYFRLNFIYKRGNF
ncbi:MAG: hypothetical protein CSB55_06710 [Candidatus Cloacimonadota bacterium]|nr:MAG: hypothetical protein CSB55_06710 [Candidatus Cloacimonadota bacterium]